MFKYLIQTVEQLIYAMLLSGLLLSYVDVSFKERNRYITQGGVALGLICACVMSYYKNATNKIDTGFWNLGIFAASLAAFLLFLIFLLVYKKIKVSALPVLFGTIFIALQLFYAVPDALAYPYTIYQAEKTIFSTDFIVKSIGVLLGFILAFVAALAVNKAAKHMDQKLLFLLLLLAILVNQFKQISSAFSVLLARRMIASNHTLFVIAKYASNYSNWFIYAGLVLCLIIPLVMWMRSFHVNEPYTNPAEHRKIRAKWRNIRRWSTTVVVCAVLIVLNMTVVDAYVNREAELSPVEDAVVENGNVYVPFDAVNDGHLHRFGYTTDNGITVRFIVIQKPNSSAYGIGLDACDICGETGYYEKDGQVVCNLCDVVMNINTIGFKGGCNPIVIDYSIENGYIVVPVEGLVANESEFK